MDYCANALIASAWEVSEKFSENKNFTIPIYNFMFEKNNITFGESLNLASKGFHAPLEGSIYYYSTFKTPSLLLFKILFFIFTTIPSFLVDKASIFTGKETKYFDISERVKKMLILVSPFMLTNFKFKNENLKKLLQTVTQMNGYRGELNFDLEKIDWNEFYTNFLPGIKEYFFKEDMSKCQELAESYKRY